MKDPAFLFYSKDFYEGTRTMLPVTALNFNPMKRYQFTPTPAEVKYWAGIHRMNRQDEPQPKRPAHISEFTIRTVEPIRLEENG